jgi:DNA-binding response OmpR family regulator
MIGGKRLLLIDGNDKLRGMLCEQLQLLEAFVTVGAASTADALQKATSECFDVIILDAGLLEISGREVCRLMRRNGVKSPIIMLIGSDTIHGLDAGANDIITKPFKLSILLARLRDHIGKNERRNDAVFTIGPYTFQPGAKRLIDNLTNKKVRMTDKEGAILKYLCIAGDKVVGRDVLLDEVWGYNAGITTHTLETHVYRLRKKIEADPSQARILVTELGGYRLVF